MRASPSRSVSSRASQPAAQLAMALESIVTRASTLAAPTGPDYQDLRHMGMWVEGVQAGSGGRGGDFAGGSDRLLVARNKTSGRRWIVDPITGIGHPEEVGDGARASEGKLLPPDTLTRSGGPFPCEHCGKCKMLVLRLPDRSVMKKCLACRRFVVDGRVERAPRIRSSAPHRYAAGHPTRSGALVQRGDGESEAPPRRRRTAGRSPSTPLLPLG